ENLGEKTRLTVTTDGQVRYRVERTKKGHRLSLYIHGASLSWRGPLSGLPQGPVKKVNAYQQQEAGESIVKVAVQMIRNSPYMLFRDQNQIVIEFDNPGTIARGAGRRGNLRSLMSVDFQNADLAAVLRALAHEAGFDLVLSPSAEGVTGVQGMVTITINQQVFENVLDFILRPRQLAYTISRNILRVGSASEFATKTKVFTMKNLDVKNSNIQETITEAFTEGSKGKVQIDTHNNRVIVSAIPSDMIRIRNIMRDMDVQRRLITRTYDLSYIQPQKIIPMIKASLSSLGSVEKNEQGNALVVTDLSGNMPRISDMISRLDTKAQQVMIEARIVEISRSNKQELGISWDVTSTDPAIDPQFTVTSIPEAVRAVATITLGMLKSGVDLNATISMLEAKGAANTISNPRVATLNNQTATLKASKNIPYQTSMVSNGVVSNVIEYLELPITLTVTPQITKDRQVLLNPLVLEVTTIVKEGAPPITSSRSATTQMLVKDGETIAIGGMVRDEEYIKESKVPLLGDIPLLGLLFKSRVKIKEKIELVVFLTPHILE
ncbi:AMIN domain-containing protein, partial [bacterium]|nr:AMIN domain-containing protein [bacterium]